MFNWLDYYTLSNDLLTKVEPSIQEAYYRCAISRFYYSAYHQATEFAKTIGFTPNTLYSDSSHKEVIVFFNQNSRFWIGDKLKKLKYNRKESDYNCNRTIDLRLVKTSKHFYNCIVGNLV